jgi:hypothetical protein
MSTRCAASPFTTASTISRSRQEHQGLPPLDRLGPLGGERGRDRRQRRARTRRAARRRHRTRLEHAHHSSAGVGKSTLATHFAVARRGKRPALFVFDETVRTLQARSAKLGLDLEPHIRSGLISVEQIDSAEYSAGQFTHMERGAAGLVVAGECLTGPIRDRLYAWIGAQPAWSDPAIIIVGGEGDAEQLDPHRHARQPLVPAAAALPEDAAHDRPRRAAQRARRRQYQVRDLLRQKEEAERRKDEYLAMLAHELRNPLAPLRTGLKLLRLNPAPLSRPVPTRRWNGRSRT